MALFSDSLSAAYAARGESTDKKGSECSRRLYSDPEADFPPRILNLQDYGANWRLLFTDNDHRLSEKTGTPLP
jgi:hypothetical protein